MSVQVSPSTTKVVPIGELRERVTIQRATAVADTLGGQSVTWADVYEGIPAKVVPVRGGEAEVQGREMTMRSFVVIIRHGYTITTADRLVWGSVTMNVRRVENRDGMSRRLTLECEVGRGT